jgi:glycosyltransferase involved in cell wall biosynthesis
MRSRSNVSVIIATYNRAPLLDECLEHLLAQPFNDGDEVIVVDNGSADETSVVVARHRGRCTVALRLLSESTPGKSFAIATGAAIASGDILALTDDDVNVDAGWLDGIRSSMRDPGIGMVGGPVNPRWEPNIPAWIRRARDQFPRLGAPIALLDYGPEITDIGPRTLLGANLAVRRELFLELGGYPTQLGKLRGTLLSGEDHELCRRVLATGLRAVYIPTVTVAHWVPANRARIGYFLRWFYWSGVTHAVMDSEQASVGRTVANVPIYLPRRALCAAANAAVSLLSLRGTRALDSAIDIAFCAGYAAQRWRLGNVASRAGTPAAKEVG